MTDPVKTKIIELVPEILELRSGCKISEATGIGTQRQQKTVLSEYNMCRVEDGKAIPDHRELITYSGSGFEKRWTQDVDFTVIGRPITLPDVLRAICEHTKFSSFLTFIAVNGCFYEEGKVLVQWNLTTDYDSQTQETKDFIGKQIGAV